jgi:hypothetical protein
MPVMSVDGYLVEVPERKWRVKVPAPVGLAKEMDGRVVRANSKSEARAVLKAHFDVRPLPEGLDLVEE